MVIIHRRDFSMVKSGKSKNLVDAEWERVMRNPENMLVSDSLKERVESIMSSGSDVQEFSVDLSVGDRKLSLSLARFERSGDKIILSGTCDKLAVKPMLSLGLDAWSSASITCNAEVLFSIPLSGRQLEISYEFPSLSSVCMITIVAITPATKSTKRVL